MHILDLSIGWLMDAARWLIILVLSLLHPQLYSPWTGKVVEIVRPHEIKVVKKDGKTETVRLYGIHCPLGYHAFAKDARKYVSDRLLNNMVKVQPLPGKVEGPWYNPKIELRDAYGRIMALVSINGESVNRELLRKGIAWWYKPLVPFERGFKRLEDMSREAKRGLWHLPNPSPAWNFKSTPVGETNPFQEAVTGVAPSHSPAPAKPKAKKEPPERPSSKQASPEKAPLEKAQPAATQKEPPLPEATRPSHSAASSGEQGEVQPPPEKTKPQKEKPPADNCREQEYLMRLARAYRAITNLVARCSYICSQIALNWEKRAELAELYQLNPEGLKQAEQLLKEADSPCPGSIQPHEQVKELWALCLQLNSMANAKSDNEAAYASHLEELKQRSGVLVQTLKGPLAAY